MVGGLVEDEHVGLPDHQAAEHEPGRLAARQRLEALLGVVAAEQDHPELAAREAGPTSVAVLLDPGLRGALRRAQVVGGVLGEVPGVRLISPCNRPGICRQVSHHDIQQRRFADPVRADDRQPVTPHDVEVDPVQHPVLAEGLADAPHLQHLAPARPHLPEAEDRIPARTHGQRLQRPRLLLDQPQLALRLPRLRRLGPEPVHELAVVRDLALALGDLLLAALPVGRLRGDEARVVAGVAGDRLVVDVEDVGGDVVEEAVVVADHDRGPAEPLQELLQPPDREDVEVVGGLVEEQGAGPAREDLGQQDPQPEAAGKCGHRVTMNTCREPQSFKDRRRARVRRVAVVPLEDVLQRREAARVEVLAGARQDAFALGHRAEELLVAHERDIEDRIAGVQELILPQDPEAHVPGHGHRPRARRHVARQDVQQRRLPRPVSAHQPVALAGIQPERRLAKEGAVPEGLLKFGDGDHGRKLAAGTLELHKACGVCTCGPGKRVLRSMPGAWRRGLQEVGRHGD